VGLDNISVAGAAKRGIAVVFPHAANASSVAEYAIGVALALMRGLCSHDRAVRAGGWDRTSGRELRDRTWGTLGAGATGLATARLAREFGMRVVAYDPYKDPNDPDLLVAGVRLVELRALCAESDVVSVHLPSTPETSGLVDRELLRLMRPETILISVGRGNVIDEEALVDALAGGAIAGAALDVRSAEPPTVGRLEELQNVLLTPHVAGITEESQERITKALADDIRAVLSGGTPRFAVVGAPGLSQ
jgi:phosphoglycerate dehydrogenase-like enzyme